MKNLEKYLLILILHLTKNISYVKKLQHFLVVLLKFAKY